MTCGLKILVSELLFPAAVDVKTCANCFFELKEIDIKIYLSCTTHIYNNLKIRSHTYKW